VDRAGDPTVSRRRAAFIGWITFLHQHTVYKESAYAGCFALALAKLRKAELVTGDQEFKAFEGEVKILWL